MRVYNITDIETDALKAAFLTNVSIVANGVVIAPGTSEEVGRVDLSEIKRFLAIGALAINNPPEGYKPKPKEKAVKKDK